MRAAIYARALPKRPGDRSCEDQLDLCSAWAERHGFEVVASYADQSPASAAAIDSLEFGRLQRDARSHAFEVVLAKATDVADLTAIAHQLAAQHIAIMAVADFAAHADATPRATIALRTRQGLRARVAAAASTGGRCYGYEPVPGRRGELAINAREAAVVVRIFELYAAGATPRAIAATLNSEGIPGPRGGRWNASTINGSRARQNGIIANALYAGEMIWNRQRFIKDPSSGKRVSRPNPAEDWVRVQTPHLQIVHFNLFLEANALKARKGGARPEYARAPKHPLSGLLQCSCGAPFIITGTNRLGCARHRESGDCDNATSLTLGEVERRTLATLEAHLADPDAIAARIREAQAERNQGAREARVLRRATEDRLGEINTALERIVDRIVDRTAPEALLVRMHTLETERKLLEARLGEGDPEQPVLLHPATAEHFRQTALELRALFAAPRTEVVVAQLVTQIRELVDSIVIGSRLDKGTAPITVYGALADILVASKVQPHSTGDIGRGERI